jgi:hypothetical protein
MFGNNVKIKLKNDPNSLSVEDLSEDIRESLNEHMIDHQYCNKCGAKRTLSLKLLQESERDTKTGKLMPEYYCYARCPNGHKPYRAKFSLITTHFAWNRDIDAPILGFEKTTWR